MIININLALGIIEIAKSFGYKENTNGCKLYGFVPHIGPQAWFHEIYTPITENDIKLLEYEIGRKLPKEYVDFLTHISNGMSLYSDNFALYGMRKNYERNVDASRQPYSLHFGNSVEKLSNCSPSFFIIGGYAEDGSKLILNESDGSIFRCDCRDASLRYCNWKSLEEMINHEVIRYSSLFDENGLPVS